MDLYKDHSPWICLSRRFDGPDGPDDPPPAWATLDLLTDSIHAAAARVGVDVQPIGAFGHGEEITEQAVASYVAKYATKAAETTGTVDRRIGNKETLVLLGVPDHPARLIETCLDLHALYPDRKLRDWAHMLGPRPLLHQVPPLLDHPRRPAPDPSRLPRRSAARSPPACPTPTTRKQPP